MKAVKSKSPTYRQGDVLQVKPGLGCNFAWAYVLHKGCIIASPGQEVAHADELVLVVGDTYAEVDYNYVECLWSGGKGFLCTNSLRPFLTVPREK